MSWLTPLGFLGFIGLLILLLIYILKPNYQIKFISTTHVWRLSLKYRKKKLPISKLRNMLLILCQILIISACAFILAQPFIDYEDKYAANEKADMREHMSPILVLPPSTTILSPDARRYTPRKDPPMAMKSTIDLFSP